MSLRVGLAEAGASVADLGTLLPIAAALVLTNGVDPVAAFAIAGGLFIVSGVVYGVPMPVQPIKAAAAIAIATHASQQTIAAAGLEIGVILLLLGATRGVRLVAKIFPKPVIRGNQLGVGVLLVIAAVSLIRKAPGEDGRALVAAGAILVLLIATERARRIPVALAVVLGGIAWSVWRGAEAHLVASFALPAFAIPDGDALVRAFTLLVIPQIPLTLGNAVVGTADLEREYYGARASRVTEEALCTTCGLANVAAGLLGGMPLCHGSSGATAYHRFGARTAGVNMVIGVALVVAGVAYGRAALDVFALIPPAVLGALLAFTGMHHALLVRDLDRGPLAVALAMGIVGGVTRNLMIGMAVGIPLWLLIGGARAGGSRRSR